MKQILSIQVIRGQARMRAEEKLSLIAMVVKDVQAERGRFYESASFAETHAAGKAMAQALYEIGEVLKGE